MRTIRSIFSRLTVLFHRDRRDADMSAELQAHIEALTERNVAAGLSPEDARHAALREFGGVEQIKERCRDEQRAPAVESFLRDVGYGLRQWTRAPGFACLAICILALAIGACTAVYSTIDAVLLHPRSQNIQRVMILREARRPDVPDLQVSPPHFLAWRKQLTSFEHIAAFRTNVVTLTSGGEPLRAAALDITPEYFEVYGVKPVLGRALLPAECDAGEHVAVISHAIWQREFAGSDDVIGRTIEIDGDRCLIVGVAPRSFEFNSQVDVYRPLFLTPKIKEARGYSILNVLTRLRVGVTPAQADAELRTVAARIATAMHEEKWGESAWAMTIFAYNTRDIRSILLALLGAVGCVLLVACANVANLLLARGTARQREIAVRIALGASRGRIVRQLLIESMLLAVVAGVFGVVLAVWGLDALKSLAPPALHNLEGAQVSGPILAVAMALSLGTGLVFGLAPAWLSSQVNVSQPLKQSAVSATANRSRARFRSLLVAFEIAAALILLTGAALLTRSFDALTRLGPGLDLDRVTSVNLTLPSKSYHDAAPRVVFASTLIKTLRARTNVAGVAVSNTTPLGGGPVVAYLPDATIANNPADMPVGWIAAVSPDYFSVVRLPLIRGRVFAEIDTASAARVVVINHLLAERYFPGSDPIGRHLAIAGTKYEIVGVVADIAQRGLDQLSSPQIYGAFGQWPMFTSTFNLMLRTSGTTPVTRSDVRSAVASIDPTLAIGPLIPLEKSLDLLLARQRFATTLLNLFALIGALIAGVGVYAVMAYAASQRTTEIGIRRTFGASSRDIFALILGQAVAVIAIGVVAGVAGAYASARMINSMLYEVGPQDPLTLSVMVAATMIIAFAACLLPAFRATRVDPMTALRME